MTELSQKISSELFYLADYDRRVDCSFHIFKLQPAITVDRYITERVRKIDGFWKRWAERYNERDLG